MAASFYLEHVASGRTYGPYAYEQGGAVGEGKGRCELVLGEDGQFRLKSLEGDEVWGPFRFRQGEPVNIAGAPFQLLLEQSRINGQVRYPLAMGTIRIDLVPVTARFVRNLARLGNTFDLLELQHQRRTAPVRTGPIVHGAHGFRRDGVAVSSEHDAERSRASRDRQAVPLLKKVVKDYSERGMEVAREGDFALPRLSAGQYVLVGQCKGRSTDQDASRLSEPVFWWQVVNVASNQATRVQWNADNSMDWGALFESVRAGAGVIKPVK